MGEDVLITGGSGRLGRELKKRFSRCYNPNEPMFDVTDPLEMWEYIRTHNFKTIIHCAARTDVSECERTPFQTYKVNSLGTYYLAEICKEFGIKLIYISTDHVFDGEKGNYTEDDIPNPQCHYSKSKLIGEWFTLAEPNNLVIRTSFMDNFTFKKAYTDKFFSAEHVEIISDMITKAVNDNLIGLWHIAGDRKNIYTFARGFNPHVKPMELWERPTNDTGLPYLKDTSLDITKWRKHDSETR